MRTICIDITYDGTDYVGWQKQPGQKTIQGYIENALSKVCNEEISIIGSGRTDTGVHAKQQAASFTTKSNIDEEGLRRGCNTFLPADIRIIGAKEKSEGFHAIASCQSKKYRYFFTHSTVPNVFLQRYAWLTRDVYDLQKMKQASESFLGTHDFASFATHGVTTKTTTRTIHGIEFGSAYEGVDYMEIHASGFLRHMVRTIMGTLMEVGVGERKPENILDIIKAQDREKAGKTAPAEGLFLWEVIYPE